MSNRPINPKCIKLSDLQPGDVILSAGSDWLDTLIKYLDQGDYSHTSQYIGVESGNHMVVEATTEGIKYQNIEDKKSDMVVQDLVDVYRYESVDGHHLGDPGWPVDPLINMAKTYAGGKYAYGDLGMIALMLLAVDFTKDPSKKEFLRIFLPWIGKLILSWLEDIKGKTPMTCVQVATSCHWEAKTTPEHKYAIQVIVDGSRDPFGNFETSEIKSDMTMHEKNYHHLRNEIINHLGSQGMIPLKGVDHGELAKGMKIFAGSTLLPLGACTPRDMQYSPTLKFVGCLKDERANTTHPCKDWT